jgi:alanine dehydrogenase
MIMIIGVPMEIKSNENRVALTPGGALELAKRGHQVFIQKGAGIGSGFEDSEYIKSGAKILPKIADIYAKAEMIMKVKEPIKEEYKLCRKGQLIFTYFHFASSKELTDAMIESGAICLAYETVETYDRQLPLLIPMSEVAGRMAVQEGAKYLERPMGGRGVLLGGVPGVPPGKVLVLGGGIVGTQAAKMAAGLGAQVTILDVNLSRLRYLNDVMPQNVVTMYSNEYNVRKLVQNHDLVIGAVLIPGAKAPKLITKDMLKTMRPGTVVVDVAVDQGGCFETTKATTHDAPIYTINGVIHYCVANMPGAVPYTSTLALTNATLPYAMQLATKGWMKACRESRELRLGLNVVAGKVVYAGVAQAFKLPLTSVEEVLEMPSTNTAPQTKTTISVSNATAAPKKGAGRPKGTAKAEAPAKLKGKAGRPKKTVAATDATVAKVATAPKKSAGRPKVAKTDAPAKPKGKAGRPKKAVTATDATVAKVATAPKKSAGRPKVAKTDAPAKPKGKAGRPKKVVTATDATVTKVATAPKKGAGRPKATAKVEAPAKPKGKAGRPKKTVTATDATVTKVATAPKKGAGRPKGTAKAEAPAKPKGKAGRPKKGVAATDATVTKVATAPKKGAGRPKGTAKAEAPAKSKGKAGRPKKGVTATDATVTKVATAPKKGAGRPKSAKTDAKVPIVGPKISTITIAPKSAATKVKAPKVAKSKAEKPKATTAKPAKTTPDGATRKAGRPKKSA